MIKFENPNGYIEVTNNYFSNLVGRAAQSCFGVTGMVNSNPYQSIKSAIMNKGAKENLDQGVVVKSVDDVLTIDLHISVSYGVNINAIVESIVNKVRYTVEEATDLKVSKVNVYIDALN
ncbi:MAG: Asp23/Gls24 family envelope stress response protein [Eubacteriales bacterium]|nr:Asp23/Gls24 family envelope stress response protein [Eubacteriales bacterium]